VISREISSGKGSAPRRGPGGPLPLWLWLCLPFIIGVPNCLPSEGSCVARPLSLSLSLSLSFRRRPFLFCGNACVPVHNLRMSCGLYRADTCPTYRLVIIAGAPLSRCSANLFRVKDRIVARPASNVPAELIRERRARDTLHRCITRPLRRHRRRRRRRRRPSPSPVITRRP